MVSISRQEPLTQLALGPEETPDHPAATYFTDNPLEAVPMPGPVLIRQPRTKREVIYAPQRWSADNSRAESRETQPLYAPAHVAFLFTSFFFTLLFYF